MHRSRCGEAAGRAWPQNRDAVLTQHGRRARMHRVANLLGARRRRLDVELLGKPTPRHHVLQHELSHGRSADVAVANEKDANGCLGHGEILCMGRGGPCFPVNYRGTWISFNRALSMLESRPRASRVRAGGASRDWSAAMESILFAAAAVATIAGFVLEVWREMKSTRTDDEGRKRKGQR